MRGDYRYVVREFDSENGKVGKRGRGGDFGVLP